MKYRVLKAFRDKETKVTHSVDSIYETSSKERAQFLQEKGYLGEAVLNPLNKVLDQNANEVVDALPGDYSKSELEEILELETSGNNRKTVKKHIETLLKGEENDQSGTV